MSIIQPNGSDTLAADNHALMHKVFAIDSTAVAKEIVAGAVSNSTCEIYSNTDNWQDYSGTSTITGWTTYTTKKIYYKRLGKQIWVTFNIAGTSNATSVSFTLPYASDNVSLIYGGAMVTVQDNGTTKTTACAAKLAANASTVNCYTDMSTGSWTNSGTKQVAGTFVYEIA